MAESAAAIDEQIRQQENEIELEVNSSQPLVGDLEAWSSIEQEYADNAATSFVAHLIELGKKYSKLRRIRRDGNCFYRAFLFGYLEYLIRHHAELETFRGVLNQLAQDIIASGYQSYIIQDMHEPFDELLKSIVEPGFNVASLLEALNEQNYSNYYVAFLRVIVSYQLQKEEEFFVNFIDLDQAVSVRDFCTKEVEPMAKEADNIQMIALAHALQVSFRVESVDPRSQWQQDFGPTDPPGNPALTLLFKPGHYDIIYAE